MIFARKREVYRKLSACSYELIEFWLVVSITPFIAVMTEKVNTNQFKNIYMCTCRLVCNGHINKLQTLYIIVKKTKPGTCFKSDPVVHKL